VTGLTKDDRSVVLTSPEAIMQPPWKNLIREETWAQSVVLLALDEVHCMTEW